MCALLKSFLRLAFHQKGWNPSPHEVLRRFAQRSNAQRVQPYHRHWNDQNERYSPIVIQFEHHSSPSSNRDSKEGRKERASYRAPLVSSFCRLSFIVNSRLIRLIDTMVCRESERASYFQRNEKILATECAASPEPYQWTSGLANIIHHKMIIIVAPVIVGILRKGVVTIYIEYYLVFFILKSDGLQWVEMGGI